MADNSFNTIALRNEEEEIKGLITNSGTGCNDDTDATEWDDFLVNSK